MKVNKFSLLFIAGAVVVAAGLMAVQKKVVVPSGEAMQAQCGRRSPRARDALQRLGQ
ncbi:hypothetical protein [Pseudomonas aeruginosa]|uniref:hypothetical protein n=1 Tax=Pseudomonas aeruginosa TaxID=287 RepID=UPI003AB0D6A7